jgi:hypothetical protein
VYRPTYLYWVKPSSIQNMGEADIKAIGTVTDVHES